MLLPLRVNRIWILVLLVGELMPCLFIITGIIILFTIHVLNKKRSKIMMQEKNAILHTGEISMQKSPADIKESYFLMYLDRYIYANYSSIDRWEFGNKSVIRHHDKIFLTVRIFYVNGISKIETIKTQDVYRLALRDQHIAWQYAAGNEKNKYHETDAKHSNAELWLANNMSLIAAKTAKAKGLGTTAFPLEVPELTRKDLAELAALLIDKTAYNVTLDEAVDKLYVEITD